MSNRIYNVLFHTHTVSGLVISVALFVIFFAGSLSFFRDDIIAWERNQPIVAGTQMEADFEAILDTLESQYGSLYGRDIVIRQGHHERKVMVSLSASKDTTASEKAKAGAFLYLDTRTYQTDDYYSSYTLGEFLYRLHFFAQIPYPYGYFFSGFVAFFFLFATVTGVIVHWKKIIPNFYLFRPGAKLKTVWTDAHTALGVIGLPFQFVFAVTGAVLIIGTTVMLAPASSVLYADDTNKLYQELRDQLHPYAFENEALNAKPNVGDVVERARFRWEGAQLCKVEIQNYGDANMHVIIEGEPEETKRLVGRGMISVKVATGQVVHEEDPLESPAYVVGTDQVLRKLHFGNYGGYGLKIIYFSLAIITCFVIISGVLIWVEARNKKSVEPWKRKSNEWIAAILLATSLAMFPVTAFTFSMVKIFLTPETAQPHVFIYKVFFISWLVLSLGFSLKKDNYFTIKYTLVAGSILALIVPVANGLVSGNWIWNTFNAQQLQVFVVDAFWGIASLVALGAVLKMKPPHSPEPQSQEMQVEVPERPVRRRKSVLT